MKMLYTLIAAGLFFTAPVAAIAAEAETTAFEHDGMTYVYSVTTKGKARIIRGVEEKTGKPFKLYIANGRVRGTVDSHPVEFSLRDVKKLPLRTEVAVK